MAAEFLPPAVAVHSRAEAARVGALAAASGRPATLLSLPGAAQTLGAPVFAELLDGAREAAGPTPIYAVLDCLDGAAEAIAAFQEGLDGAVCWAGDGQARLAEIAEAYGATLWAERPRAISGNAQDQALTAWLAAGPR